MNIKRRITAIGLICSLMVLIFGGQSPATVMADDTKIVEAVNHSRPYWSNGGSWNSWKNWYINKRIYYHGIWENNIMVE